MIRVIAEIGSVHDGSYGNACKLIEAAAAAGAHAVKFQTHIAESESLPDAPSPAYFSQEDRFDYFNRTAFSINQWKGVAEQAKSSQVEFISSPFSLEAVDLLENVGVQTYKIPSGEVTNVPLLERIAGTAKPVILSSGMSDWKELDRAVDILRKSDLTVLQCTSAYPCPPDKVGINVLIEMRRRYGVKVGLSDHTMGFVAAMAAAAHGAVAIEKHFTFSRLMYGSDAKHSMEPAEFKQFTAMLQEMNTIMQSEVDKNDLSAMQDMKRIFEKSIVSASMIPVGTVIEKQHIAFKKPGNGISASNYSSILGRVAARDIPVNHMIEQADIK